MNIKYSDAVMRARERGEPILALESTIISHGMPFPENLSFAKKAESLCRDNGVEPATIAVIDGVPHVGLELEQLDKISRSDTIKKVSKGALGLSIARGWSGATTVSSTAHIANIAEIPVFSTGGIGGVHRDAELTFDISQDLIALSQTPIVVIASGAKSILDIPKTVELLETLSITTVGYNTKEFPSFYSRVSGVPITAVESPEDIINVFNANKSVGHSSATLVANPIPAKSEIPKNEMDDFIESALVQLSKQEILGKEVTPFLLKYVAKKTGGRSLEANIALALNNVALGIEVAKKMY